ncbi:MAG: 5-aminolevulinate synthase [Albidovulum sp.]
MDTLSRNSIYLIPLTAMAYAVATLGIKMYSDMISPAAIALIVGGFTIATLAEAHLLRTLHLGTLYMVIMVTETVLVLCLAAMIGEGLSFKQLIGAGFVLGGMVLVNP